MRKMLPILRPALRTHAPTARLREVEYRGVTSAGMIYDHLPIIDHFRRADEHTLLGVMDLRGLAEPYFFVLRRETRLRSPRNRTTVADPGPAPPAPH